MIRVSCFLAILFLGVRVYIQIERIESYSDKKKGLGVKVKNVRFILQKKGGSGVFNAKNAKKLWQKEKGRKGNKTDKKGKLLSIP